MDIRLSLDVKELRRLRKSQGLSQEALAYACELRRLRVSIATIKRVESGKPVSLRTARELAKYYAVELDSIMLQGLAPNQSYTERAPVKDETLKNPLTILWLRFERRNQIADVLNLLQRRGSVWQEQLGSVLLAAFGNFRVDGKGHLHAQHVALEVRELLQGDNLKPTHFYGALRPGSLRQDLGRAELTPEVLQWFARKASGIPVDGIVVSSSLYRMSNSHFNYRRQGTEGESVWLLQEAICLEQKLPLVGRSSELLQLNAILECVGESREPAIAHITGPAGIGKSRLLATVHEQARLRGILIADVDLESGWGEPSQLLTSTMCRSLYARAKDMWSDKKLRDILFNSGYCIEEQLMFAELLNIAPPPLDVAEQWKTNMVSDEPTRLRSMASLFSVILGQEVHSLLIIVDNLHLAGQTGYRWLVRLLEYCRELALTFVVTSRIETNAGAELQKLAAEGFSLSTLMLGPLSTRDVYTLCDAFTHLDDSYKQRCIALAEGVPLYLIQLLTNVSGRDEEIPPTLQLLVEAKLAQIKESDRRVIELLSVCDAPIPLSAISELLKLRDYSPEHLVVAQLVKVDSELGIKLCHQLVRHVIYQRLSSAARCQAHRLMARYIEEHFDCSARAEAYTLARHLEGGEEWLGAAQYNYFSATQLLQDGLYDEALELLNKALETLFRGGDKARDELEINIQLALSSIFKVKYGWVSPLLKSSYQRIEHLCQRRGPDKRLSMALFGLWTIELSTLNFRTAEALANRCLALSEQLDDPQGMMHAYIALSNTLFWRGQHRQAENAAQNALDLYHPSFTGSSIHLLGQDPRALAGCFGAWSASLLGETEKAEKYRQHSLVKMRLLGHDFSLAIALQGSAWLDYHHGNAEQVLADASELEQLSIKMGFPFYRGVAALFLGWARHKLFRDPEAMQIVDYGYHQWLASSGDKIAYSLYCTILGEILVETNRLEEARHLLESGIEFALVHDEACYLPEMYRLLAHCLTDKQRETCLRTGLTHTNESPLFAERILECLAPLGN